VIHKRTKTQHHGRKHWRHDDAADDYESKSHYTAYRQAMRDLARCNWLRVVLTHNGLPDFLPAVEQHRRTNLGFSKFGALRIACLAFCGFVTRRGETLLVCERGAYSRAGVEIDGDWNGSDGG
jgi:hypothetical protein